MTQRISHHPPRAAGVPAHDERLHHHRGDAVHRRAAVQRLRGARHRQEVVGGAGRLLHPHLAASRWSARSSSRCASSPRSGRPARSPCSTARPLHDVGDRARQVPRLPALPLPVLRVDLVTCRCWWRCTARSPWATSSRATSGSCWWAPAGLAIGTFGSALTKSQVVAAVLSGVMVLALTTFWMLAKVTDRPLTDVVNGLAWWGHFDAFRTGLVHLKHVDVLRARDVPRAVRRHPRARSTEVEITMKLSISVRRACCWRGWASASSSLLAPAGASPESAPCWSSRPPSARLPPPGRKASSHGRSAHSRSFTSLQWGRSPSTRPVRSLHQADRRLARASGPKLAGVLAVLWPALLTISLLAHAVGGALLRRDEEVPDARGGADQRGHVLWAWARLHAHLRLLGAVRGQRARHEGRLLVLPGDQGGRGDAEAGGLASTSRSRSTCSSLRPATRRGWWRTTSTSSRPTARSSRSPARSRARAGEGARSWA